MTISWPRNTKSGFPFSPCRLTSHLILTNTNPNATKALSCPVPTNYIEKKKNLQCLSLPGHSCLILLPIWRNYSRKRITKPQKYEMGVKIPTELIKFPVKYAIPYSRPGCGRAFTTCHGTYSSEFLVRKLTIEKSTIIMYIRCTHVSIFPSSPFWVRRIGLYLAHIFQMYIV